VSALSAHDLTAAFDTTTPLLHRLERLYGLRGDGVVLARLSSYLTDRSVRLLYNVDMFFMVSILCSVSDGSVFGPRLFVLCTAKLE